ncbi:hypothetical protein BVC80_1835g375 [Macleaya cordata]|uniref:Uncharacterized protein n=1 Tax=Macleaya cordata TaxID=56857 RepID=A0A200R5K2_MACCD|nr:hypothetical protein BVC80_1835g375 [Macleaya cordata]
MEEMMKQEMMKMRRVEQQKQHQQPLSKAKDEMKMSANLTRPMVRLGLDRNFHNFGPVHTKMVPNSEPSENKTFNGNQNPKWQQGSACELESLVKVYRLKVESELLEIRDGVMKPLDSHSIGKLYMVHWLVAWHF